MDLQTLNVWRCLPVVSDTNMKFSWRLVLIDSSPQLSVNVSDTAKACPAVSNNTVAGLRHTAVHNVCTTTVWNRPAQPLPAETCDMREHLLTFPCHSRQRTRKFREHARFFFHNIYSNKWATIKMVCKYMTSYVFRPKMAFFRTVVVKGRVKVKAIPLQAWKDPKGSWRMRFPDFKTIGT